MQICEKWGARTPPTSMLLNDYLIDIPKIVVGKQKD